MSEPLVHLADVPDAEVPEVFLSKFYFDFDAHPFDHQALFDPQRSRTVIDVLDRLHDYLNATIPTVIEDPEPFTTFTQDDFEARCVGNFIVRLEAGAVFDPAYIVGSDGEPNTLYVRRGARVLGVHVWLDRGSIVVGEDTVVEPGAGLVGPVLLGRHNTIRQGAYLRGDVLVGDGTTLRGEIKNSVMMNKADFPHPCYVGDSLCGFRSHFGNQATSANLRVLDLVDHKTISVEYQGTRYDTGRRKVGIILGDFSQVGCNTVSDPGVFLGPWVICYQLNRLNKGFYGPDKILKNKPLEHEVLEQATLRKSI
jgi:UDP-N-acetylglucosamine diphosphorylase / glucose-1-phosphate thymidylyltransferase / UDP-N-acetylgalactosamine diphosphorylase / glucosamine-1-phosphate N-acetyltransferase / galactosamine-1-phosphate N-acetyltransferase